MENDIVEIQEHPCSAELSADCPSPDNCHVSDGRLKLDIKAISKEEIALKGLLLLLSPAYLNGCEVRTII